MGADRPNTQQCPCCGAKLHDHASFGDICSDCRWELWGEPTTGAMSGIHAHVSRPGPNGDCSIFQYRTRLLADVELDVSVRRRVLKLVASDLQWQEGESSRALLLEQARLNDQILRLEDLVEEAEQAGDDRAESAADDQLCEALARLRALERGAIERLGDR